MKTWQISLKTAVALAFLAVAAIPVWMAWEWPQSTAIDHEQERAEEMHVVFTEAIALALEQHHPSVVTAFGVLADDLLAGKAPDAGRQEALETFGFNHLCIFDAGTGALQNSLFRSGLPCPEVAPEEKMNMFRAFAQEDKVHISEVTVSPAGRPMLLTMRRNGPNIAVGSLDTGFFRRLAGAITFGDKGHAVIVDRKGGVLAHPKDPMVNPPGTMADIDVVGDLIAGQDGTGTFPAKAMDGMIMATAYRWVPEAEWGILVNQPQQEMTDAVAAIKSGTLGVLALALVIATALAMLAAHLLLDPITRIRKAAERLGSGEGSALIEAVGAGARLTEISDLRAAFNAMVLRIRRSQRTEIAARREAQEATRIKSRFLANMSHELRTPLNAIIGFADVTRKRMEGPERAREREYLGYVHDSGHHLLSIINDLLDLSKIEAGGHELQEEDVDPGAVLREVRALLGPAPEEKGIDIGLFGTGKGAMLWADRRAVKQMMLNLATNAVRYTQEGGRVRMGCEWNAEGAVSLVVEDNGPGIEAEELEKIRSPFARGRAHETAAVPGTGLGLSIVDALADLHGARFDLTSAPGQGTRAKVTFPTNRSLLVLEGGAGASEAAE